MGLRVPGWTIVVSQGVLYTVYFPLFFSPWISIFSPLSISYPFFALSGFQISSCFSFIKSGELGENDLTRNWPGIEQTNGALVVFGGGLPIDMKGHLIGAVGVSGGTVPQDVEVAQAGVDGLVN